MPQRAFFALSHLLPACLALAAASALAQPAAAPLPEEPQARAAALEARQAQRDAERRSISARRQVQAAQQHKEETACYRRFAVENCLAKVREQARTEESALHQRELELNDAERREKSSERLHSIEQKQNEPRKPQPMQGASRQPLSTPQQPAKRTQDDVLQDKAASEAQAQQRAQQQQSHVEGKQRQAAERVQSEAERRAVAQEKAAERAADSAKRHERRDKAVSERKGAPLPMPEQQP
ncbi:hypothetical protein [Comamonas sp. GB3 AK4-5]|uniref:hypothetical protein n=1 Tax=Comamonas sp. GB3 AK4-5 TaxID=3231487 RepID=UPI00351EDFDE